MAQDPQLESRPTFLFFKGAASGLFAEGTEKLRRGVDDQQALLIGIKCERGSHKFFKRYGERFEDSEGKQIFLEFADEERVAPRPADPRVPRAARAAGAPGRPPPEAAADGRPRAVASPPLIDLHTHTTASDGRCTPAELVARAAAAGVTVLGVTDHDTVAGCAAAAAACAARRHRVRPRHRDHRGRRRRRRPRPRLFHRRGVGRARVVPRRAAAAPRSIACAQMIDRLAAHGIQLDAEAILAPAVGEPVDVGRPAVDCPRAGRRRPRRRHHRGVRAMAGHAAAPAFVPRMGAPPAEVFARIHEAGGIASLAHPALVGHDEWIPAFAAAGLDALEAYHSRSRRRGDRALPGAGRPAGPRRVGRLRLPRRRVARPWRSRQRLAAARLLRSAEEHRGTLSPMAQALVTAVGLGTIGQAATAVLGLFGGDLSRHITFGIFSTLITLLAHSMMMFYLIGKGKAVKDAMAEGGLTGDYFRRIADRAQAGVLDRHAGDGVDDDDRDPRRERRHGRAAADRARDDRVRAPSPPISPRRRSSSTRSANRAAWSTR